MKIALFELLMDFTRIHCKPTHENMKFDTIKLFAFSQYLFNPLCEKSELV